jgi:hypothetical protein
MLILIISLYVLGVGFMGYGRIMILVNGLKDSESNKVNMLKILFGFLLLLIATFLLLIQYA